MVITEARETLAACCVAVLQAALEADDVDVCAAILGIAISCDTPTLSTLSAAAEDCFRRRPAEVSERCMRIGVSDVENALHALAGGSRT